MAVSIMLSTPFPMYIAWGKEYTQLYNDGYRPILGSTKHPQAMGISTKQTFSEIWHIIGSMFDGVMKGEAVGFPNFMLPLDRNGYTEECYFDFSYSPIYCEDGDVGGVLVTVIEVTEKLKALNSLKETQAKLEQAQAEAENQRDRLKRFFMQAPAAICVTDGPELVFELVNPAYQQFFPGRKLLGKPVFEALPEIKGQPIADVLTNVYRTGETFQGDGLLIPLARYDGGPIEDRYFNFIYQPRFNTSNEVDGILVFAFEVTEMIIGKRLLEDSEKRFRLMVEQSPVPMLVTRGEDMVFEEINAPMLELINRDMSIKGKPAYEVMPELQGQAIMDHLYNTFRTGEEWTGLEQPIVIKRNGRNKQGYYNISYKPLIENGRITGVLQSAVDVTEHVESRQKLKESSENFKLLADNMSQLAWMADGTGAIYWYNQRWYDFTGTNYEQMQGWGWREVHHPDHLQNVIDKWVKFIQQGEVWEDTFPLRSKDGEYRWFLSRATPLKDEHGKTVRWFGTNTDITEQRALVQQKDDFLSIASHELKTPITSLKASLQLLERMKDNPVPQMLPKLVSQSSKSMQRISTLVEDLLNVTKLNNGNLQLNLSEFNIAELLNDCCNDIRLKGEYKLIVEGDSKLRVQADEHQVEQVLVNLVNNAVKYASESKTILLLVEKLDQMAKISVKDFGPGISRDKLKHLFDRYYRATQSDHISGLGLGLYICSEIVKRHGGQIGVESKVGKGSTFWFTIPLADAIQ
ncbi:MAG: PAS domain-containing protein [Bacteroidota bacterium]|nr:PAS domain-containing protein [Bacteroidota bacterium]